MRENRFGWLWCHLRRKDTEAVSLVKGMYVEGTGKGMSKNEVGNII